MTEPGLLTASEVLMLLEGLDKLIPFEEGSVGWKSLSQEEIQSWTEYRQLRRRLQEHMGMRMHETARGWLSDQLRRERMAVLEHLQRTVWQALKEPQMTRSELRRRFVETMRKCQEIRPHS